VLGREVDAVLRRFLTQMPQRFEIASGRVLLQGVIVEVDEETGRALGVRRVCEAL
jgi:calcineurin-like phosphoesterase